MGTLRRLVPCVAALAAAALVSTASASAAASRTQVAGPVFVVTGGGLGHGVGMSQWGAFGQAQQGRTFEQILDTYYPGTVLGSATRKRVRVLVGDAAPAVEIAGPGEVVVRDAAGQTLRVPGGLVAIDATFEATLGTGTESSDVTLVPPVRVHPAAGGMLSYGGVTRRGDIVVTPSGTGMMVVNDLSVDAYLRGVLAREMPTSWPLEALKAQAVAARTFAFSSALTGRPFDLYDDARSQVYGGVAAETPATDRAVRETAGRIVTYEGAPALTLYFASSGGRTSRALDVFGTDVPYLQSVDDPWDASSPYHLWLPKTFTAAALGKALGLRTAATDVATVTAGLPGTPLPIALGPAPSLRVRVTGAGGATLDLGRDEVRGRLGLVSTTFRIGVLALATPAASAGAGARVALAGIARDVDAPVLERQGPDGTWLPTKRLAPRPDGTFSATVRPVVTTVYRVAGSGVTGSTATVVVPAA